MVETAGEVFHIWPAGADAVGDWGCGCGCADAGVLLRLAVFGGGVYGGEPEQEVDLAGRNLGWDQRGGKEIELDYEVLADEESSDQRL